MWNYWFEVLKMGYNVWLKICVLKTTHIIILFSVTTKQIVNDVSDACLLVVRSFIYHSLKCW